MYEEEEDDAREDEPTMTDEFPRVSFRRTTPSARDVPERSRMRNPRRDLQKSTLSERVWPQNYRRDLAMAVAVVYATWQDGRLSRGSLRISVKEWDRLFFLRRRSSGIDLGECCY